jgi:NADH dehydrogenase
LVRDASGEAALREAGAEPFLGDMKDPASLAAACAGVSTVLTTANSVGRGGEDTVETVDLEGNRQLVEAAAQSGVEHFIFVSAQGEDPDHPVPFLRAKGLTSQLLRRSGMGYTVLLPDIYMDVWIPLVVFGPVQAGRPVSIVGGGRRRHNCVAVRDVAGIAAGCVGNEAAVNRDLLIGGPEAISWSDIISVYERVNGVEVEVHSLAPGVPMPGFPDAVAGMMAALETYDSPPPLSAADAESIFGVQLTTVENFLTQMTGRVN